MRLAAVCGPAGRAPTLVAIASLCLGPGPTSAGDSVPFDSYSAGTFTLAVDATTGAGDLRFAGAGIASHLGLGPVAGHSVTTPSPTDPLVSIIDPDHDAVTLVAANGDELYLSNAGEDRLDPSVPGRLFIRGSGTFRVTGGTGRFAGATGSGTFEVVAEVTGFGPAGPVGTFDLRFTGTISPPGG
jgi:hypothetical protein